MMDKVKAVRIEGLYIALGREASRVEVLKGIDLTIEAGEAAVTRVALGAR